MRTGAVNISAIYSPQMLPFVINALPSNAAKLPDSLVFSNLVHLSLELLWCVRSKYDSKRVHIAVSVYLHLVLSQLDWTHLTILATFATIIWPFNVFFFTCQSLCHSELGKSHAWRESELKQQVGRLPGKQQGANRSEV